MSLKRLKQSEAYRFANLYRDTDAANASYPCLYAVDISFKESWLRENKNKFEKVRETYLALIRKANKASLNHPDKARNKPLLLNDLTSFEDLGRDRKTDKQLHAHAVWFIHPKVVARFKELSERHEQARHYVNCQSQRMKVCREVVKNYTELFEVLGKDTDVDDNLANKLNEFVDGNDFLSKEIRYEEEVIDLVWYWFTEIKSQNPDFNPIEKDA